VTCTGAADVSVLDCSALTRRYGEMVALIASDRRLTFRDLEREAERAADGLAHLGLSRGDALALVPRRIVVIDEFPMTHGPNGAKVQKVALRSMAEALLDDGP
jgi:hypothetical protein